MRTFDNFPPASTCPLCGKNDDKPYFLLPIDGTKDGNNIEAQPAHVDCLMRDGWRLNKEAGVVYCRVEEQ